MNFTGGRKARNPTSRNYKKEMLLGLIARLTSTLICFLDRIYHQVVIHARTVGLIARFAPLLVTRTHWTIFPSTSREESSLVQVWCECFGKRIDADDIDTNNKKVNDVEKSIYNLKYKEDRRGENNCNMFLLPNYVGDANQLIYLSI